MTQHLDPYISRNPGDPINAEDWNQIQVMTRQEIEDKSQAAVDALERVNQAGDADKFGGKSPDEYAQYLIDRVLSELPARSGYQMIFKDLKIKEEVVLEHGLHAFPLVDVYQLDYFKVVASEDAHVFETWTTFYLYHSSESRIRFRPEEHPDIPARSVAIDPEDGHPYRIPFQEMLDLYNVKVHSDQSLGDVENEFWQAFFSPPNDVFSDDQYFHSVWFDRCCREERRVGAMKRDWDDIWFQARPRKTVNYPATAFTGEGGLTDGIPPAPTNLEVVHFDFNTLGVKLLHNPVLPSEQTSASDEEGAATPVTNDHLKVMLLLKV